MPTSFQKDWTTVKDNFIKRGRDIPPEFVLAINQGNDFGPALKKFDGADGFEAQMKAMPAILRARAAYEKDVQSALKQTESRIAKAGLSALMNGIDAIVQQIELAAQPPRPSGSMVSVYTLRSFDLAAGVSTEYLRVNPVPVTVDIECDKVFKQLIENGQAGLRAQDLGDEATAELTKLRVVFQKTIQAVDATIKADPTLLVAKTKEANEVLQYYGKLVQDNVDRAVQTAWKDYLGRKQALSDFRVKSASKVVLGTIGVAVAVASAVLSFGAAWMNIIAACKGIVDLAKAIKTWAEEIDTVWEKLNLDIDGVTKLIAEREKERKSQAKSKAKQIGKEVVAAVAPFSKDLVKALSATEARVKQFNALLSKLETKSDELSGTIETITRNLGGLPDRMLSTSEINLQRRMAKRVTAMATDIGELHKRVLQGRGFARDADAAVKKLKSKDTWTGTIEAGGGAGSKGVALYAAANFCVECAKHGKTLLSLLPV